MKYVIWFLVLALVIVHQDIWFWTDESLVFGFIPIGLAYHAGISIAASIIWWLATIFAWPKMLEGTDTARSGEGVTS